MQEQPSSENRLWDQVEPLLDAALDGLGNTDREIVLLRFVHEASYALIGNTMHMTENTATKRVARALDRLRRFLNRRGTALSVGALTSFLAAHTAEATSATMAGTCAASALAAVHASGAGTAVTALADSTLKAILAAQVKTVAAVSASVLTAGSLAVGAFVAVVPDQGPPFSLTGIAPFPLVYMAQSILPDGTAGYQLNTPDNSRTHFVRLGDTVEGYTVIGDAVRPGTRPAGDVLQALPPDVLELILEKAPIRITLVRGQRPEPRWSVALLSTGRGTPLRLLAGESFEWQGGKYELSDVDPVAGQVTVRCLSDGRTFTLSRGRNGD